MIAPGPLHSNDLGQLCDLDPAAEGGRDDDRDGRDEQEHRLLQNGLHRAAVEIHDAAEEAGEVGLFSGQQGGDVVFALGSAAWGHCVFAADKVLAQRGRPGQREKK